MFKTIPFQEKNYAIPYYLTLEEALWPLGLEKFKRTNFLDKKDKKLEQIASFNLKKLVK